MGVFGTRQMKKDVSGSRLAIGLLLLGTMWMVLKVSGLLRVSPIHLPAWAELLVAGGVLAGPAILTLVPRLPWVLGLVTAAVFLVCAFVFPWFYEQFPALYWLTILLAYVEVFGLIPLFLKKRSVSSKPQTGQD
jgi:hypothetical protein